MQQHRHRPISGEQPFQPRQQGLALALQVPAVTVARRQRQLKSQALRAPEVHPVRAGCVGLWGRTEGIVTMPTEKGLGDAVQCCQLPAQMLHRLRIVAAQRQILQHQISLAGTAAPANRPGHAHGCGSSQFFQPGRFGSEQLRVNVGLGLDKKWLRIRSDPPSLIDATTAERLTRCHHDGPTQGGSDCPLQSRPEGGHARIPPEHPRVRTYSVVAP